MTIERRRLRVYVAGPISSDVFEGVHRGMQTGRRMFLDGLAPFIPHTDAFFFLANGSDGTNWNAYLEYDLEYILVADAVYRLQGESRGADLEVERARGLHIPVFEQVHHDLVGDQDPGYRALMRHAAALNLNGKRGATV
jgi:hypothetical protein